MIDFILFIIGICLLVKGADYLVEGSSSLAKKAGISTLIIGLTVVAFGTSLPELVVNVIASLSGNSSISFGNIVGSSIANILLILGISAIIIPLKVKSSIVWREIPFALLASLVLLVIAGSSLINGLSNGQVNRSQGIMLLLFFVIFLYYITTISKGKKKEISESLEIKKMNYSKIFFFIIVGLIALYVGGKWTVDGAIAIARFFGVSEYIISLVIISIGTSLPELMTSVVAVTKKETDLAIGNIIGSNVFNIFWVLGVSSILSPILIPVSGFIDVLILVGVTLLLFVFMFLDKKNVLQKWQGVSFVLIYVLYLLFLFLR